MRALLFLLPFAVSVPADAAARARPHRPRAKARSVVPREVRRVTLQGKVLLPDGRPAAGARVYVSTLPQPGDLRFKTLTADARGAFRYPVVLDPVPVTFIRGLARAPGFKASAVTPFLGLTAIVPGKGILWQRVRARRSGPLAVTLRLSPGATVAGRLLRSDGSPAATVPISVESLDPGFSQDALGDPAESMWRGSAKFVPNAVASKLFRTKSDGEGRFVLKGLPTVGQAQLALGGGATLAPGSASPIPLDAGTKRLLLVASRPGAIHVRLSDPSGQPLKQASLFSQPETSGLFFGSPRFHGNGITDEKGEVTLRDLPPGTYRVFVQQGGFEKVTVQEGQTTEVALTLRNTPLKGRVVDASGAPVAGASIDMVITQEMLSQLGAMGAGFGMGFGRGSSPALATTDNRGEFEVPNFPWTLPRLTLRATRENDLAVWEGDPRSLGEVLELKLRSGGLVSVTGRLLDPHRKPLKNAPFTAVRWQDAPRITWFFSAKSGKTDASGKFQLAGLERGEAFSLTSGSPFGGMVMDGTDKMPPAFESPRFETGADASGPVDLGEVVVHPLEDGAQLFQLYGLDSPSDFNDLLSFMAPPSAGQVREAKAALAVQRAAVAAGNVEEILRRTSRLSLGWSEDRAQFLLATAFPDVPAPGSEPPGGLRAMRFVPRVSMAYLLSLPRIQEQIFSGFNLGAAVRQLESDRDWVILASPGETDAKLAGIMHREEGEWKRVSLPSGFPISTFLSVGFGGAGHLSPAGLNVPAPKLDAVTRERAHEVAGAYLAAWTKGDAAAQLRLTSPLAQGKTKTLAAFKKRLSGRLDEGISPLEEGEAARLEPVTNLTVWEQGMLAGFGLTTSSVSFSARAEAIDLASLKEFPDSYVRRGDLATFRYQGGGRSYLMVLARTAGTWRILEPAIRE
jgi:hypothetical protein